MRSFAILGVVVVAGCAAGQPDVTEPDERSRALLGQPLTYLDGPARESPVDVTVRTLLARELSVDDAIRIALLRNMELQAFYEELGVADADLVQAALPENPTFHVDVLQPDTRPSGTALELEFSQDLVSVLTISARRAVAEARMEQTRALVTARVVDLAAQVRGGYYGLQGALQARSVLARAAEAAGASLEYAQALHRAGNLSDLELANQRAQLAQAEVELARLALEVIDARERMNALLGLWGPETAWSIAPRLPELPDDDLSAFRLESLAVAQRLDLEAARLEAETLSRSLDLAQTFRWTPGLSVGAAADRDSDGQWSIGPHVEVTLPLFDRGQADVGRLAAQVRQAEKRYAAMAVEVRAEVRRSRDRLAALADLARRYRDRLLPARRDVVEQTLAQYNFMLVGTFDLLSAKQSEIGAEREYVETLEQFWVMRSELLRVLGGRFPEGVVADAPPRTEPHDEPPSGPPQGHEGH